VFDARGGTALSISEITGCPIKMIGIGEKIDDVDLFEPEDIAKSILGMNNIIKVVEKASKNIQKKDAESISKSIQNGTFSMNEFLIHIRQIRKIDNFVFDSWYTID
jgi:signal recognition particle subunit SRP54